jgi:general secretion pathway protein G
MNNGIVKMTKKIEKGFTLIELIIVLTLIGILVGLGLPQYRNAVTRTREAVLKEDLYQMRTLINQYYTDKMEYPGSLQTLVDENYMRSIPKDPITRSAETWIEIREVLNEDAMLTGRMAGIIDVISGAEGDSLDGSAYNTW